MLKLDNNLLDELGLGSLPEDQKRAMLQHIYETLELRVGTNLANQMTDQQLEEFEKFIDDGGDANQAQALQWLETNLPNYKQVVNEVFEALKGEIKQMAPQLVATAANQPVQGGAPDQMGQGDQPPQMPPQQATMPATDPYGQPVGPQPQPAAPVDYQSQPQPQQPPQPMQQPYAQPSAAPAPQQDAQMYQFPQQPPPVDPYAQPQQPPAGPNAYPGQQQQPSQAPPQYPGQQAA